MTGVGRASVLAWSGLEAASLRDHRPDAVSRRRVPYEVSRDLPSVPAETFNQWWSGSRAGFDLAG